jgi:hypothetical protein
MTAHASLVVEKVPDRPPDVANELQPVKYFVRWASNFQRRYFSVRTILGEGL